MLHLGGGGGGDAEILWEEVLPSRVGWSLPREVHYRYDRAREDATSWLPYRPTIERDRTRHYAIDTSWDTFAP